MCVSGCGTHVGMHHGRVSGCLCVCTRVHVCAHAPTALLLCAGVLPSSPSNGRRSPPAPSRDHTQPLPAATSSCSLPRRRRYLYVKIWKRVPSLLSDLQNHPANSAWTASPARWPFSNTLAVQAGVSLSIPAPRQAREAAQAVCALGREPPARLRGGGGGETAKPGWGGTTRGCGVCR